MTATANAFLSTAEVDGRVVPLKSIQNCLTCQSPYRTQVERALVSGRSYKGVVGDLPPDAGLNVRNLKEHFARQHVPLAAEGLRRQRERDAEERGQTIQSGAEAVADHLIFARRLLGQVERRLAAGEIEPNVRDGLAAASLLARVEEQAQGSLTETDWLYAFSRIMEITHEVADRETFREIGDRLMADPQLRELAARAEASDELPRTKQLLERG